MTREFIETDRFTQEWYGIGFNDDDLAALQEKLNNDPHAGYVMSGVGNARKLRVSFRNRGKSRSARVIYADREGENRLFLLMAYTKKDKDTLDSKDIVDVRTMLTQVEGKRFRMLRRNT